VMDDSTAEGTPLELRCMFQSTDTSSYSEIQAYGADKVYCVLTHT
jgi:hypothetical protein